MLNLNYTDKIAGQKNLKNINPLKFYNLLIIIY